MKSRCGFLREKAARGLRNDGFILVVVLLILMALASLGSIYSLYSLNTAAASLVPEDRLRAEAAIRAGVELTVYQLLSTPEPARPTHGVFSARIGDVTMKVAFVSEGARIDLNTAPKEMLSGLFASFGIAKEKADAYADRVVGWRTRADANAATINKEAADYKAAGMPYAPRQAPFDSVLELNLVMGLPSGLSERVMPFVTVYNGKPSIDVVNAEPRVLSALPGVTPAMLADFLSARKKGEDGKSLLARLGAASGAATIELAKGIRASFVVQLKKRRVSAEVVFALKVGAEEPYDILYWRDDFDGPMPQA
jgi:general secretion pathway protein K